MLWLVGIGVSVRSLNQSRLGVWDNIGNGKVGEFSGIDGIVVSSSEGLVGGSGVGGVDVKMKVVLIVVNEVTGAPLDNEAASLEERLTLMLCERFNAGNAGIGNGKLRPLVPGDARATGEGEKTVIAGGVASGGERNGAEGPRLGSVCGSRRLENLHVLAEFHPHGVEVGRRSTGDDEKGAGIRVDTVGPGELIEATDGIRDDVHNKKLGDAFEREAVDGDTEALFDSLDGALNLTEVAVGRDDIHVNGPNVFANALEFVVTMDDEDKETACTVEGKDKKSRLM